MDSVQNGEEESSDDHVSRAPLHVMFNTRRDLSAEKIRVASASFNINRGPWSRRDWRQLKKNWKYIKRNHPEFADPKFAFSTGHDRGGQLSYQEACELQKRYREFDLMRRMAYKLDDRLICDIFERCRRKFYYKSFKYKTRGELPRRLERSIKAHIDLGESPKIIAERYDVSPSVVDTIRRRPSKTNTFRWTSEATRILEHVLEGYCHNGNPSEKVIQSNSNHIDWKQVASGMRSAGFDVTPDKCYYRWRLMKRQG